MSAGVDSEFPFTMVVDDPSGNSFVENPSAPNRDPALAVRGGGTEGGWEGGREGKREGVRRLNSRWICFDGDFIEVFLFACCSQHIL